ncbi:membrane protein [Actinocatenispora rupis]|uniref:Membrane protein n=2 Tax=Actinocatenispora rupis TaxID=519421 RepID=A0A8J3J5Q9_9ACTN|nr:membrane protein [Actinocatenispora rupis]
MSPLRPSRLWRHGTAGLTRLTAAGMLFGTGGILARLLGSTAHLPPLAVACYRLVGGGALLLAVLTVTKARWPRGSDAWRRIVAVSALTATYQACYHLSAAIIPVGLATLTTVGTIPVLVSIVEHVTGRRRLTGCVLASIGLAFVGLALMFGVPPVGVSLPTLLVGVGLAACSALGFAVVNVMMSRPVHGLTDLAATGITFSLGGLLLVPLAAAAGRLVMQPSPGSVTAVAALATIPTAVAYPLYYAGLRRTSATTAAILTLLEPLTGLALSVAVLGERLGPTTVAGTCLLSVALVLAASSSSRAGTPAPTTNHDARVGTAARRQATGTSGASRQVRSSTVPRRRLVRRQRDSATAQPPPP